MVSAEITYANNLDRIETIRSDGRIDGADPSIAALTGRVEVRFADQVLVNQAIAGDPCELEFGYALPSGESFTFTVHAVYLPRPRIEIAGPQGVQATFDWQAARDADARADVHRHARQRHRGVLAPRASAFALTEILLCQLSKGIRNRTSPVQRHGGVADRVATEALPDGVHRPICRPAREALARAGPAVRVRKSEREFELQVGMLPEMGDGDGEERDDFLPPMIGERRANEVFGDLGEHRRRGDRRV